MDMNKLAILTFAAGIASVAGFALAATEPTSGLAGTSAVLTSSSGYFLLQREAENSMEVAQVRAPTSRDDRRMGDERR